MFRWFNRKRKLAYQQAPGILRVRIKDADDVLLVTSNSIFTRETDLSRSQFIPPLMLKIPGENGWVKVEIDVDIAPGVLK